MRTAERGLKVIIADGECQLARQRRVRAEDAEKLKRGERVVRTRFGVDDEICTGDHSCIRLSGCPSLTVKPNPDPLRTDPVATVIESCVGCGLCGEVAHAAVLCPSFYRAEIIRNPSLVGPRARSRAPRPSSAGSAAPPRRRRVRQWTRMSASARPRPITMLIAALGGEGGGVLTDWIVAAAVAARASRCSRRRSPASPSAPAPPPITSRSCRCRGASSAARRPVLALAPGVGDVDIVLASELLEAGRAIAARLRHARSHADDRLDQRASIWWSRRWRWATAATTAHACSRRSSSMRKRSMLLDMEALAKQSGAMINAVMLGIIAGCGRLPIPATAFEAAIRADGKAVDANLARLSRRARGCAAGRCGARQVRAGQPRSTPTPPRSPTLERAIVGDHAGAGARRRSSKARAGWSPIRTSPMRSSISTGWRRSAHADERAQARRPPAARDRAASRRAHVLRGRDPRRAGQDRSGAHARASPPSCGVKPGEPFTVTEFLKPGIEEMCSILPPALARRILALAERRGWLERVHWGMEVNTASVSGYLRFWLLAKLRRWRPQHLPLTRRSSARSRPGSR